jgi:hypothetical protein
MVFDGGKAFARQVDRALTRRRCDVDGVDIGPRQTARTAVGSDRLGPLDRFRLSEVARIKPTALAASLVRKMARDRTSPWCTGGQAAARSGRHRAKKDIEVLRPFG